MNILPYHRVFLSGQLQQHARLIIKEIIPPSWVSHIVSVLTTKASEMYGTKAEGVGWSFAKS